MSGTPPAPICVGILFRVAFKHTHTLTVVKKGRKCLKEFLANKQLFLATLIMLNALNMVVLEGHIISITKPYNGYNTAKAQIGYGPWWQKTEDQ